jgi:hypothetical protein
VQFSRLKPHAYSDSPTVPESFIYVGSLHDLILRIFTTQPFSSAANYILYVKHKRFNVVLSLSTPLSQLSTPLSQLSTSLSQFHVLHRLKMSQFFQFGLTSQITSVLCPDF